MKSILSYKSRLLLVSSLVCLALAVAACSSIKLPGATTETESAEQNLPGGGQGQPFESRVAMGTLYLEDTEWAVTAQQAADLLPLWKAVKALSSSDTASQEEISALYTQIKESMSAEQVQAIEEMRLEPEAMTALMEKYGIEAPQNPMGDLSEDERATRVAQFQSQGGAQGGGDQGGFDPGMGGGMPPGGGPEGGMGAMPGGGQRGTQGTQVPGMGGRRGGGSNSMFVDPVIKLLEERAGQ